jgi:pilus assembly protein Flp/PilA
VSDFLLQLITDEAGVSAIEYAILGALIAVGITVGANTLGQNLGALFNAVAACVQTPGTGVPCAL